VTLPGDSTGRPGSAPAGYWEIEAEHPDGRHGRRVGYRRWVSCPAGDPVALRAAAAALREYAGILGQCLTELDLAITALTANAWTGESAVEFAGQWAGELRGAEQWVESPGGLLQRRSRRSARSPGVSIRATPVAQ